MTITAEITLYVLHQDYEQRVIKYIHALRKQTGIEIRTMGMSTYVRGEFNDVFRAIQSSILPTMEDSATASFVVKYLNADAFDDPQID